MLIEIVTVDPDGVEPKLHQFDPPSVEYEYVDALLDDVNPNVIEFVAPADCALNVGAAGSVYVVAAEVGPYAPFCTVPSNAVLFARTWK